MITPNEAETAQDSLSINWPENSMEFQFHEEGFIFYQITGEDEDQAYECYLDIAHSFGVGGDRWEEIPALKLKAYNAGWSNPHAKEEESPYVAGGYFDYEYQRGKVDGKAAYEKLWNGDWNQGGEHHHKNWRRV